MIRFFYIETDADEVARIHSLCHPTWPKRDPRWWACHPTLVMEEGGVVIGSTSFSLSLPPTPALAQAAGEVCYGHGVEVDPALQGTGRGWVLAEARHRLAKEMGAKLFLGMTWEANAPMRAIFAKQGLLKHTVVAQHYAHNDPPTDGWMFVGRL